MSRDLYSAFFNILPQDYRMYESITGNEIGIAKLFIDNGLFLAIMLLLLVGKYIRPYRVFIYMTLMHYSFYFNNAFIVIASVIYCKEIYNKNNT